MSASWVKNRRPEKWPGVHAAKPLLEGKPAVGKWINRTAFWEAGGKRREKNLKDFAEQTTLYFSKIPSLSHLSDTAYQSQIRQLSNDAVVKRRKNAKGRAALGAKRLQKEGAWRKRTPMSLRVGCAVDALCSEAEAKRIRAKPKRPAPRIHTHCEQRRNEHQPPPLRIVVGLTETEDPIMVSDGNHIYGLTVKEAAVQRYLTSSLGYTEVAAEVGAHHTTLRAWVSKARARTRHADEVDDVKKQRPDDRPARGEVSTTA